MATHPHSTHAPTPNVDKSAAYVGMIGAVIFLLIVVVTIVKLTNSHYASEKGGEGAAATATH